MRQLEAIAAAMMISVAAGSGCGGDSCGCPGRVTFCNLETSAPCLRLAPRAKRTVDISMLSLSKTPDLALASAFGNTSLGSTAIRVEMNGEAPTKTITPMDEAFAAEYLWEPPVSNPKTLQLTSLVGSTVDIPLLLFNDWECEHPCGITR